MRFAKIGRKKPNRSLIDTLARKGNTTSIMDLTQDALFSLSSSIPLSGEPCALCDKAIGKEPCDDAGYCKKYLLWLEKRRGQMKRITKATARHGATICHNCPVYGACPVSFEESLSLCPVKLQALRRIFPSTRQPR